MRTERLFAFLRARTGFELAVYAIFSASFLHGLVTGKVFLVGRTGAFAATAAERPLWYWPTMAFSALCLLGLAVSVRAWWRNRSRWFRE